MKKRILALLLAVLMLLSVAPITPAFAVDELPEDVLPEEPLTVEALYDALMAAETLDEFSALLENNLPDEESGEDFLSSFTDEQLDALVRKGEILNDIPRYVNYTEVGPLMSPVTKKAPLKAAKGAKGTEPNPVKTDGLETVKTVVKDENGYKITLESWVTGTVSDVSQSVPTDVVLVLDESGSMEETMFSYEKVYNIDTSQNYYIKRGDSYIQVDYCNETKYLPLVRIPVGSCNGWYTGFHLLVHIGTQYFPMTSASDTNANHTQFYTRSATSQTKNEALKAAAASFVNKVYDDAVANNVDHRVSVIGFSNNNSARTLVGLSNDIRNNKETVLTQINSLRANGGTYIEDGMTAAKNAFDNAAATTSSKRNKVVIIFTDGIPGSGSWGNTTINNSANPAIATANTLKNGSYGATIYTIGLIDGADPELEISNESNDTARTNKFLHYLSSNYPNATSMSDGGTGSNQGYYLAASDSITLNVIFEKISDTIKAPAIDLGSTALVQDAVSPYFDLPADVSAVKTYVAPATAANGTAWGTPVATSFTKNISDGKLTVTGFDFAANMVSDRLENGDYGKKLIVEFTVTPKDGFLGGNGVPTNDMPNSGIYNGDTLIENFVADKNVDVPIPSFTIDAQDKNVYLLGGVDADEMLNGMTIKFGEEEAQDFTTWYNGLEDWQKDYVSIALPTAAATTNLTKDTTYTATVTIAPSMEEGAATASSDGDTANINVFKPTVTFKDSTANANTSLTKDWLSANDYSSVKWLHGTTEAGAVNMIGTVPTLTFTYNKENTTLTADVNVTVTAVTIGATAVTPSITFAWTANSESACCTTDCNAAPANAHFRVHIANTDLTVKKEGMKAGETAIFTVTGDGKTLTIAIVSDSDGKGQATIKGLRVGVEYSVTEQLDWSWRYKNDNSVQAKTLAATASDNVLTFTNVQENYFWLDAFHYVKNLFTGTASN